MSLARSLGGCALCLTLGCATTTPRARLLESATFDGPDRYWAVGSSGRAELFDGSSLVPWDYPMDPELDAFYYEPSGDIPTASVRIIGRKPFLFTRAGDIFSFEAGSGWQRFSHRILPERGDERPQIDHVLVTPGDRLVIHVHSQVVLSGTLQDFANGDFARSEAPTFFTHMEAIGTHVYGVGWDQSGYVRQLFEVSGAHFQPVVALGRDGSNDIRGILALGDGSPIAVLKAGLVPGRADTKLEPFAGLVNTFARNPKHVPRTDPKWPSIARVFSAGPGRALLLFDSSGSDRGHDLVELRGAELVAFRCDHSVGSDAIGALGLDRGFVVVTSSGRSVNVPGPHCRERAAAVAESPQVLDIAR